jgi:hypothetical protein
MLVYCKSSFKPKKKKRTPVAKAKKFVPSFKPMREIDFTAGKYRATDTSQSTHQRTSFPLNMMVSWLFVKQSRRKKSHAKLSASLLLSTKEITPISLPKNKPSGWVENKGELKWVWPKYYLRQPYYV